MTFESGRLLIDVYLFPRTHCISDTRSIIISNTCFLGQKNTQNNNVTITSIYLFFFSIRDRKTKSRLSSFEIKQA